MSVLCRALVLGDNVSTDLIHPPDSFSRNLDRLASGFLRGAAPQWSDLDFRGAVILAGENFGCGSSREVAASVFIQRGVRLVLARSFARIFYRNLVNLGMPIGLLESEPPWPAGSLLQIELDEQRCSLRGEGRQLEYRLPAPFLQRIVKAGGLLSLLGSREADRA